MGSDIFHINYFFYKIPFCIAITLITIALAIAVVLYHCIYASLLNCFLFLLLLFHVSKKYGIPLNNKNFTLKRKIKLQKITFKKHYRKKEKRFRVRNMISIMISPTIGKEPYFE